CSPAWLRRRGAVPCESPSGRRTLSAKNGQHVSAHKPVPKDSLFTGAKRLHRLPRLATSRPMKVKDADILIIPGYTNSGPDHWQTRWENKLSTARRVEQAEWSKPVREDWVANVVQAIEEAVRPVVLVAHSLGIPTAIH